MHPRYIVNTFDHCFRIDLNQFQNWWMGYACMEVPDLFLGLIEFIKAHRKITITPADIIAVEEYA